MNNFLELVKSRQSVRSYLPKEVEKEKLDYLMECVRFAPSAVNFQPWKFIIIKSDDACNKLRQCYAREWFNEAPVYIIACTDHNQSWHRKNDGKDHGDIDISIAVEHLCLAATEQGLGTCWVCNFDAALCSALFNLPENVEPAVLIPLGYAKDETIRDKQRKNSTEIIEIL